jgi:23S rRNA (pseudouridine1915-N3)-methyltransferase
MRIRILSVGRMKSGPERDLLDRYHDRASKSGRALGIARVDIEEIGESRAQRAEDRMAEEATSLLAMIPDRAAVIVLDETGRTSTSPDFARMVGDRKDQGTSELVFVIGGPDGHGPAMRARADQLLAFGAMTWPHQIVRVLLAEQIYRAITILSGHPYHRV